MITKQKDRIKIRVECNDTIIIANDNTTIGYATMDTSVGDLTYIFVHPAFRRRGLGAVLVLAAEKAAGHELRPAEPISPLGRLFFNQ
jgi:N-acetylglutamate synthase-like GNAT family acetyltransferase